LNKGQFALYFLINIKQSYSVGIRNPNHKELRQIKAKYGNLEKKLKQE